MSTIFSKEEAAATPSTPFGLPVDPSTLSGTVLTSAHVLVTSVAYNLNNHLFSYVAPGADSALDATPQLWKTFQRRNAEGKVPEVTRLEVRSGASNAILGFQAFQKDQTPITAFLPGHALVYMQSVLSCQEKVKNLNLQVSALAYDEVSGSLVSDYAAPLTVANKLGYSVFTPLSPLEAQHFALLNQAVSQVQPSVHLYEGPAYLKESGSVHGVISNVEIAKAYKTLLQEAENWKTVSSIKRPAEALKALNRVLGTSYSSFQYYGHESPETVYVVYGSKECHLVSRIVEETNAKVGCICVRVPLPFNTEDFVASVPSSCSSVVVLGQVAEAGGKSELRSLVAASFFMAGRQITVQEFSYVPTFLWTLGSAFNVLSSFSVIEKQIPNKLEENFVFWNPDNSEIDSVPAKIALALSMESSSKVSHRAVFDNVNGAGTLHSTISKNSSTESFKVVVVEENSLLSVFNVLQTAANGATVVVVTSTPIADVAQLSETLPIYFRRLAVAKNINIVFLDLAAVSEENTQGLTKSIAVQSAFYKYAYPELEGHYLTSKILHSFGNEAELVGVVVAGVIEQTRESALHHVAVSPEWLNLVYEDEEKEQLESNLPVYPAESWFGPNPREADLAAPPSVSSVSELSKKLVFKESYKVTDSLRPDLPMRNFVVKVKENKRVTPEDYSRNIFQIEFDVSGTGLTYTLGEALGVHARNSPQMVAEFIQWYGLNPHQLVQVPSKEDHHTLETRTVEQSLIDNLDLFGKVPKRFIEALAPFATSDEERKKLEHLGSAAGAAELKKIQEEEWLTFVDILQQFPSAKPSFAELVTLIPALKRREYSIASSQKVHPTEVHLLIVVVDWVDPRGRKRFGQCSHYLSQLARGTELVVSVKPSVMKLPPNPEQPIIMSGLGTGLAPFKALVEEKILQKQQGLNIGEVFLFLGSRHQREEYLYGEFWEAAKDAGVITHIGAAFSRDQPEKIYIQDRIRQTLDTLTSAVMEQEGYFYLCGPTWPVPDISACLQDIIENDAAKKGITVNGAQEVENMKETGRYILEVY